MAKKRLSYNKLTDRLAAELSAVAGREVMPPVIQKVASDEANWDVLRPPRNDPMYVAVQRVMAEFDLDE